MTTWGFYAYPWNLHGPAAELAEMRRFGMTHVTVAASYHAGKFLQPRDGMGRVYFPEDGTVYFRPQGDYGVLKPQVARITEARDLLAELCAGDMPVRAWTVLNHNSRLGWEHPDVTVRNAWGDPYPYSLCPAHPDVRAYDIALCADLARYGLESLLLETPGWLTYAHGYHHEFAQTPANAWLDAMMGLCFCRHCVAGATAAGIDAEGLQARIRTRVDAFLATDMSDFNAEARIGQDRQNDPDLQRFLDWRCDVVTALCGDIRAAVRPEVKVRIISTCQRPHATTVWEGGDLKGMDTATDGLELPIYQPSAGLAEADLRYVIDWVGLERLSVILRPGQPDMSSEAQVAATLARVTALGIQDISFYNYGMLPAAQMAWLERSLKPLLRERTHV